MSYRTQIRLNQPTKFIALISVLLILVFESAAIAADAIPLPAPSLDALEEWQDFQADNPDAQIVWGKKLGRPYLLYGFDPIQSDGDYVGTLLKFILDHPAIFGVTDSSIQCVGQLARLENPHISYQCDREELGPQPGLLEGEWYEPSCPEVTVISLKQTLGPLPYLGGEVSATYNKDGYLIKIFGEYLGQVETPLEPLATKDVALAVALDYLNLDIETADIPYSEEGYKYVDQQILPVWVFRIINIETGSDRTLTINADSLEVLSATNNVDNTDQTAWGYTLDTQAAVECNEPANRWHLVDDTYDIFGYPGAFDAEIHVYDMNLEQSCNVGYLTANDIYAGNHFFNNKCVSWASGGLCNNSDGLDIEPNSISTWTAYIHLNNARSYWRSLGFNEHYYEVGELAHGTRYEEERENHNLTVIVNKNPYDDSFCGDGHPGCFKDYGFPFRDVNEEQTCYGPGRSFQAYIPSPWSTDHRAKNRSTDKLPPLFPTIVLAQGGGVFEYYEHTPYYEDFIRHPGLYHEFTHYVEKAYMSPDDYWELPSAFNEHEEESFKEGFAMYFAASMERIDGHNFDKSNLTCDSDHAFFMYQPIWTCCTSDSLYQRGKVLTQTLWDLRNGWDVPSPGQVALGRSYVDNLAYQAIFQGSLSETATLTDMYFLMVGLAVDELSGDCPIGDDADCMGAIVDAFHRHGVCYPSCEYTNINQCDSDYCDPTVGSVICPGSTTCLGPHVANCPIINDFYCCNLPIANPHGHHGVCYDNKNVIVNQCHLYTTQQLCANDCTQLLWSHAKRQCMINLTPSNCHACDNL